jgi:hypothetical protein
LAVKLKLTETQLSTARNQVKQSRADYTKKLNDVQSTLATKASADDVKALGTDVNGVKTDLSSTKGNIEQLRGEHGELLRERIELRREPKYPAVNRWHIERWVPPETYGSPRTWYAQTNEIASGQNIAALGPYPSRGEYEHCFTLETPNGQFIQLTPTIAEHIARAMEYSRCAPKALSRSRLYDRAAREDRAYEDWAFDLLDDATPAFHRQPFVTIS